jgi:soluble lytic murein transglycosylase
MLIARDAMDKLEEKPDRTDLRWRLVYPVFYFDDIQKSAGMAGVNAPLMLSIAREESYFNPLAQSAVNARGLMQLMPDTAAGVASSLGMTNYTLFSPEDNTKLGCKYYSQIRGELNGQDIFAVAAYNGGIGAVKQWINSLGSDTDNVVEHIPYPETKNYVKKVMRSYWNYVRLYDGNN